MTKCGVCGEPMTYRYQKDEAKFNGSAWYLGNGWSHPIHNGPELDPIAAEVDRLATPLAFVGLMYLATGNIVG